MKTEAFDLISAAEKNENVDEAKFLLDEAILTANNLDALANTYDYYAYNFYAVRNNDFDQAIKVYNTILYIIHFFSESSALAQNKISEKTVSTLLINYADVLLAKQQIEVAIQLVKQGLVLAYSTNAMDLIMTCSKMLVILAQYTKGMNLLTEGYQQATQQPLSLLKIQAMEQYSYFLGAFHHQPQAVYQLTQTFNLTNRKFISTLDQRARIAIQLARYLVQLNKQNDALQFLNMAMQWSCKTQAKAYEYRACLYAQQKDYSQAINTLEQAIPLAKNHQANDVIFSGYKSLAYYYRALGNKNAAAAATEKMLALAKHTADFTAAQQVKQFLLPPSATGK